MNKKSGYSRNKVSMDEEEILEWKYLNSGLNIKRIEKKNKVGEGLIGIEKIIENIEKLKEDEYLTISNKQFLLPAYSSGYEMSAKTFKKRGLSFNLKRKTREERIKEAKSPQELLIDLLETESRRYDFNKDRSKFIRRGFHWYDTSSNHKVMSQVDNLKAIVLSSLIIHYERLGEIKVKYSNPGGNFNIEILSREDPRKKYAVWLKNLVTELPEGYADWVNVFGATTVPIESWDTSFDIYSAESNRTVHPEKRLNHTILTAIILRQYFNDEREELKKFKSKKSVIRDKRTKRKISHPIPKVLLNVILPPKNLLKFYLKLNNNVLIEEEVMRNKGRIKRIHRKLNQGQQEALISVRNILKPKDSYYIDNELNSLDDLVYSTLTKIKKYTGLKIKNLSEEENYTDKSKSQN